MRLIRWVEGRISGRKSRQKDGSATSIDDQFVYHPSPFRQKISHIATPAHNPPPKLHHQLEQRLNEQLKERLSGHFTSAQLNSSNNASRQTNQQINVQLRRTASALESRSKPKKLLLNRSSEYNKLETSLNEYNPYSLPDNVNEYEDNNHLYDNKYNCDYLTQNRYSSITQASNESAFFDYSSSSLIQEFDTPSLGKQRSRIKTNPWLLSPWTSSNSITNNSLTNQSKIQNEQFNQYNQLIENQSSLEQNKSNFITNNQLNNQTSVRNSFSFASTASSDSGCVGVNTNSMDASVLSSATNFNESLMSCSIMTNNLFINDELNDEEILTISHNNGEQIANQMNVRNYIEQINYEQDKSFNNNNLNNLPLSSTCEDFSEMSSRAESQLSAIYQQIDDLKSKIDEIDLDNGRIEAKMNSLVNFNNQNSKVNLGIKKNDKFNQHFRLSNCSNYRTTIISKNNQINNNTNYIVSNSSSGEEENNVTTSSSSYSPASSSSIASSPTSIQNSNSIMNTKKLNTELLDSKLETNAITSSSSFNSTTPSSCWSLASICSSQNIQPASSSNSNSSVAAIEKEKNSMSTINEHNEFENLEKDSNQLENVFNYLKQKDSSKLYTQLKYSKLLTNPSTGASSVMIRKKGLNNNKFLRKSFDQKQQNINRLSNGSLKNFNESWVNTATDQLLSSDDEKEKIFVNNSNNNQLKLTKFESKIIRPESYLKNLTNLIDIQTTVQPQLINNTKQELKFNSKLENRNQINYLDNSINKQTLLPNYCLNYNSDKDAFKSINENLLENKIINMNNNKSQISKPLTPFKINDNYKKLKPIKNSRIPIMKEAILENDIYESIDERPPSPAPLDNYVNKINTPIQLIKSNRQLPKLPTATTKFNCRKLNYNDQSFLISPLTQQLKFEKENQQRKLNYSFRKLNNYYPNQQDVFSSPDSGLESQSSDQNSPSIEQQSKKNLAYQIKNLRFELRGVGKAINEIKDSNLD